MPTKQPLFPLERFVHFCILTLGCRSNQYESQAIREAWTALGLVEHDSPEQAEWVLVNSCAVTENAVRDLRHTIRSANRANPEARILVTGCAAKFHGKELRKIPGVAGCLDQPDKAQLLNPFDTPQAFAETNFPPFRISGYDRARAVVKIQDGCSHRCTYCIVPLARGPARSRPAEDILQEIQRLFAAGVGEVVLSGINLRQYDFLHHEQSSGGDFWDLLRWLDARLASRWQGAGRLRCSSLDPAQLGEKGLEVLTSARIVCPHLHLSIQSGSPEVLRRMGRGHYDPQDILKLVDRLAAQAPALGLGADLLVGFPGESEAQFDETFNLAAALPLNYAHVFPYSPRPGTPAATYADQLGLDVRKERAARLRALVTEKKQAFIASQTTLPEVQMALRDKAAGAGMNEYYVSCRFTGPLPDAPERSLLRAVPAGAEKGVLLVRMPDQEAGA